MVEAVVMVSDMYQHVDAMDHSDVSRVLEQDDNLNYFAIDWVVLPVAIEVFEVDNSVELVAVVVAVAVVDVRNHDPKICK